MSKTKGWIFSSPGSKTNNPPPKDPPLCPRCKLKHNKVIAAFAEKNTQAITCNNFCETCDCGVSEEGARRWSKQGAGGRRRELDRRGGAAAAAAAETRYKKVRIFYNLQDAAARIYKGRGCRELYRIVEWLKKRLFVWTYLWISGNYLWKVQPGSDG